ncbi:MAG: response regulator [Maribacter sp.]|nr:response regulator [Maribacter sp.]
MNMLEHYKEQYINQNIQFVFIDLEGVIVESDQTFIKLEVGNYIYKAHPFFESCFSLIDSQEKEITFNCIHISFESQKFIIDVRMTSKDGGILLVMYDHTDHYITHQNITQARNESIISSELVVLKNIELEERERFKNSFIQNFSHELRNPLTSIISISNIIEGTKLTDDQRKMVHFLKDSNSNLKLMLDDIMSISMISSGRLQLRTKVFNLYDLLRLIEFTYKAKAIQNSLGFVLTYDKKIPEYVEGDRLRLFQVVTNLLDNAIKFSEKGTVSLNVQLNQKRASSVNLRFQVSDNGIGVPEEKFDSIFESFSRLDTDGGHAGSGLGLSIVKGILELMNSSIRAESTLGHGSVFYFDLTLICPLNLASKPIVKETGKSLDIKKFVAGRKYKVLLVEDDERVQTVLFKLLMDTNLFYVDLINDGALVFEEVINNTYDIILMDVDLPNVSGDQITKSLRDFPFQNIKHIPIVGITANAYEEHISDYLRMGMNAVITKPFDLQELLETILKFLKR